MRETELKFAIHDSFVLPQFGNGKMGLRAEERSPQDLRATYYDTPDLRLARNGITLRYRTGDEEGAMWSLKLPSQSDAHTREELHFDGIPNRIPDEAQKLVSAFIRSEDLSAVATLRTKRRRWALLDGEGDELAELVEDDVSVLEEGRPVARFSELELEQRGGSRKELNKIGDLLRASGASQAEPIPKAVRALGPRATAPPDVVPVDWATPDDPAAVAIRAAITKGVLRLMHNDPLARMGESEGIHQVRVAARRLRSDLRTFARLVVEDWGQLLAEELRWLGSALGEARDIDVIQAQLRSSSEGLEDDLDTLWVYLAERRERGRKMLVEALESDRYRSLLDRLVEAAAEPQLEWVAITTPCKKALPPLVRTTWKSLAKRARPLRLDDPDELWHKVRIRAKRARYAAEAVAPALEPESREAARAFAKGATAIQDLLGRHQDANVAQQVIREIAVDRKEEVFSFALGRLFERQQAEAGKLRSAYFEVWKEFDDKRHRSWMKV